MKRFMVCTMVVSGLVVIGWTSISVAVGVLFIAAALVFNDE